MYFQGYFYNKDRFHYFCTLDYFVACIVLKTATFWVQQILQVPLNLDNVLLDRAMRVRYSFTPG